MIDKSASNSEQAEAEAHMKYQGLHFNRFLYATYLDVLLAEGKKEEGLKVIELLEQCDAIRKKYWMWRSNLIKTTTS